MSHAAVAGALSLLVQAARVSPVLRDAVQTVEAELDRAAAIVADLASKDPTASVGPMEDLICTLCNGDEVATNPGWQIEHEATCPWLRAQEWTS